MIECLNVSYTYDGHKNALNNINLSVQEDEFVCVLGGNGSGKSTFAKHLNALLLPDTGTVTVNGNCTSDTQTLYIVRSTAGMVFQNPDDQLIASVVEDDVAFGPENLGIPTEDIRQRVQHALQEVGLTGFEKHETNALSGGQKQRVAIAGVLAMHPKVLILDEASSMLDPRGRAGLMRVCQELNKQGMTIILITHFMEEAAYADRVVVLQNGSIVLEGAPNVVLTRSDILQDLNLDTPFACRMSRRLQELGVHVTATISERALAEELIATLPHSNEKCDCEPYKENKNAPELFCSCAGHSTATHNENCAARTQTSIPAKQLKTPTCQPIIQFEHVWFAYDASKAKKKRGTATSSHKKTAAWGNSPEAVWALHDIQLTVHEGEFLGIAGHTGSGKSTLIQHMNGILRPTEGCVRVLGVNLADKKQATHIRENVGVVFQYPEHQLFAETVYQDVAFGPRNLGLSEDEVDKRVHRALDRMGLNFDELHNVSPFELSGGQQRRVAFAGVLAMEPCVLVLDEPMAGLDPAARREFLELTKRLHEQGLTIVMVSHHMDDLALLCDRIVILKEGHLFTDGTPEEVFQHANTLKEIGLGIPASQRLANTLRAAHIPLQPGKLYNEEDLARALAQIAGA